MTLPETAGAAAGWGRGGCLCAGGCACASAAPLPLPVSVVCVWCQWHSLASFFCWVARALRLVFTRTANEALGARTERGTRNTKNQNRETHAKRNAKSRRRRRRRRRFRQLPPKNKYKNILKKQKIIYTRFWNCRATRAQRCVFLVVVIVIVVIVFVFSFSFSLCFDWVCFDFGFLEIYFRSLYIYQALYGGPNLLLLLWLLCLFCFFFFLSTGNWKMWNKSEIRKNWTYLATLCVWIVCVEFSHLNWIRHKRYMYIYICSICRDLN